MFQGLQALKRPLHLLFFLGLLVVEVASASSEYQSGYIPENPNTYSAIPLRSLKRGFLPPKVDLANFFPPVGRQGAQSSCVGWALGYAARSYYHRQGQQSGHPVPEPFSPSFVYNQTKESSCASGSSISSGLQLLEKVGIVGVSEFPYDPEDCSRQPTTDQLLRAQQYRIKGWARVETGQVEAIKGELALGNPVVVGLWISPSFYRIKNGIYADVDADIRGGHALVVVGYDDQLGAFKLMNSWGENWGERGFGWISYDAMLKRLQNAFVMLPGEEQTDPKAHPSDASVEAKTTKGKEKADDLSRIKSWEESLSCTAIRLTQGDSQSPRWLATTGDAAIQKTLSERTLSLALPMDIEVRPWPQCEAVKILQPHLVQSDRLSVLVNDQSDIRLKEGDSVTVSVHKTSGKGYLSILYLQADGSLVSLRAPEQLIGGTESETVILGQVPNTLNVAQPLGDEMIMAIVSTQPVWPPEQSTVDSDKRKSLPVLRSLISSLDQTGLIIAYAFLRTR